MGELRPSPGDPRTLLVLDTSWNSGYLMECPLVTSLTAVDGPRTGGTRPSKGKMPGHNVGRQGRRVGQYLPKGGTESE